MRLLGAAGSMREAGQPAIAAELANQALQKWPGYDEARSFLNEVAPQATAQARSAAATVSPALVLSPTAGACGNHGPIIGAPAAPHIAAPVPAEIAVRIAIFRMQDD